MCRQGAKNAPWMGSGMWKLRRARAILEVLGLLAALGCAGCQSAAGPHCIRLAFDRPGGSTVVVSVDGRCFIRQEVTGQQLTGEIPNWEPFINRLKELRKGYDTGTGRSPAPFPTVVAEDAVPYELLGCVILAGSHAGFAAEPVADAGADFELRPIDREGRGPFLQEYLFPSSIIRFTRGCSSYWPRPEERRFGAKAGDTLEYLCVDLIHQTNDRGASTGAVRWVLTSYRFAQPRITDFSFLEWMEQSPSHFKKLEWKDSFPCCLKLKETVSGPDDLRRRLVERARFSADEGRLQELIPVIISPDMPVPVKLVREACRAALAAGYTRVDLTVPK